MAGTGPSRGIITGINVTPMVDVTLVLLVIFIVTAKIVVTPAVPLDLPPASKSEEVQVVFSVIVASDGARLANGTPMADDRALIARAIEALAADPDLRAVIQADGSVPHREVMATLDALKVAGIERIAFGAVAKQLNDDPAPETPLGQELP
jgi:biopolymer transport protein ExbD